MMLARNVTSRGARGAAILALMLATAAPACAAAQAPRKIDPPPPVAAPAPPQGAPVATAPVGPQPMSESVAAIVNDDIISTYDLGQRMRLLIATSGVQPTQETLPQFQREALVSLVDERLQLQELKRVQKDQKITIIATDDEVLEELTDMAKQNNLKPEGFLLALKQQGIGPETLYEQIRAQMSWQRWISGRYGTRPTPVKGI